MLTWFIPAAMAQDVSSVILPPVPTTGISPTVQYLLGLLSVVVSICIPLLIMFIKQHMNVQAKTNRADLINGAIARSAGLATSLINRGTGKEYAISTALDYVHSAYPEAIAATPQATEPHLRASIEAEIERLRSLEPKVTNNSTINVPPPSPVPSAITPAGAPGVLVDFNKGTVVSTGTVSG